MDAILLAVDIGLKTGLALYGRDGKVRWYRSHNLGDASRLRRRVYSLLGEHPDLEWLVLEGGGPLAEIWQREADRRGISVVQISAEDWREQMLYPRQRRDRQKAKQYADELARKVIEWSDAPRPTSLRHDAAEAVLVGLWGVLHVGWLDRLPQEIRVVRGS